MSLGIETEILDVSSQTTDQTSAEYVIPVNVHDWYIVIDISDAGGGCLLDFQHQCMMNGTWVTLLGGLPTADAFTAAGLGYCLFSETAKDVVLPETRMNSIGLFRIVVKVGSAAITSYKLFLKY